MEVNEAMACSTIRPPATTTRRMWPHIRHDRSLQSHHNGVFLLNASSHTTVFLFILTIQSLYLRHHYITAGAQRVINRRLAWLLSPVTYTAIVWLLPSFIHQPNIPNTQLVMVARSSDSESEATIIFYGCLFFFSRHTFSDVGKPTSPKLSHTTWLSIQQNLCYSDFFEVPPKTNGGQRKNPKFAPFFMPSRKQLAPYSSITRRRIENLKH